MFLLTAGGAGGGTTYEALKAADSVWEKVRNSKVSYSADVSPLSQTGGSYTACPTSRQACRVKYAPVNRAFAEAC